MSIILWIIIVVWHNTLRTPEERQLSQQRSNDYVPKTSCCSEVYIYIPNFHLRLVSARFTRPANILFHAILPPNNVH